MVVINAPMMDVWVVKVNYICTKPEFGTQLLMAILFALIPALLDILNL